MENLNNSGEPYAQTLVQKVKSAGTASIVFGAIQVAIAFIIFIVALFIIKDIGSGIFAFAIPLILIFGVVGATLIILGLRIQTTRDASIGQYLWFPIIASLLVVGTGGGILWIVLLILSIRGLMAYKKLLSVQEFTKHLVRPYYQFSGAWWAVLYVPAVLIVIGSIAFLINQPA